MARYRNKQTGEIIEVPDAPQAIPIGMQDPTRDLERPKAQLDIQRVQAGMVNDAQRIAMERERIALSRQAAGNASQAAQRANQIAAREQADKMAPLNAMSNQIARVRELYSKGPGATKAWTPGALADYLPTDANKAFDTAGRGLGQLGMSAFRVPGVGSQSDAELRDFIETNRPSAADNDVTIQEKIRNLENRLGEAYKARGSQYRPPSTRGAPRKPKNRVVDWNDY